MVGLARTWSKSRFSYDVIWRSGEVAVREEREEIRVYVSGRDAKA